MSVLLIGATSSIGRALAVEFGRRGQSVVLASRDEAELARIATDLTIRTGVAASVLPLDVTATQQHPAWIAQALQVAPDLQTLVIVAGYMGDQEQAATDFAEAYRTLATNFVGAVSLLTGFLPYFQQRKGGQIVVVSSVAGDRGRRKNYVYGSAKAGLSVYAQGLRSRLQPYGVQVLTVKPGFVDTPMTYGLEGLFLVASPEAIAQGICRALDRKRDIVYLPWFWQWIMLVIRLIPERLFKRLSV